MHALLINSDPVVSSNRKIMKTPIMEFSNSSVKQLIIMNDEEEIEDSDTCSDSE
jgi:hypothetical protein